MLLGLSSLFLIIIHSHALEVLRGVSPESIIRYQPDENGNWHCLNDPSIVISFDRVNDNYCDCPDGSDEPGTSACSNGLFFCENVGFESHFIPSFKVDDGVCDYEVCCDGSDEAPGICENRCISMKATHEKVVNEHNKKITQGFAIKQKMAEKSKNMRSDIEQAISKYNHYIASIEENIAELELVRGKTDENEEKINGNFKIIETDLASLTSSLLDSLNQLGGYISKLESLKSVLKMMTEEYNHNFNDPAVKQAAQEYLNFAASFDEASDDSSDDSGTIQRITVEKVIVAFQESLKGINEDIAKVRSDIVALKIEQNEKEHSNIVDSSSTSIFTETWEIVAVGFKRLVDSFLGVESRIVSYEESIEPHKDTLKSDISNKDAANQIASLSTSLEGLKSEVGKSESELRKNYGPDDILRSMSECITSKIGSYKYRLCPTSVLEQINSDGRGTKIGVFEDLIFSEETNNYQFIFKRGERCWNGPVREAVVDVLCGTKQEILVVTEPEKCIYHLKMVSPLGCFVSDLL